MLGEADVEVDVEASSVEADVEAPLEADVDAATGELPVTPAEPTDTPDAPDTPGSAPASPIIDLDQPLVAVDEQPKELRAEVEGLLTEAGARGSGRRRPEAVGRRPVRSHPCRPVRRRRAVAVRLGERAGTGWRRSVARPPEPATEPESAEPEPPLDHDAALVHARDTELAPLQATLARQLKRALADEQNEVFDRLRRLAKVKTTDEVLGAETEHAERYRAAGEDAVWAAALAGARSTAGDLSRADGGLESALERHRVLDVVLDEISLEVAMPVRERLEVALDRGRGRPRRGHGFAAQRLPRVEGAAPRRRRRRSRAQPPSAAAPTQPSLRAPPCSGSSTTTRPPARTAT